MVLFQLKKIMIQFLFSLSTENLSLLFKSLYHACFKGILELLFHILVFSISIISFSQVFSALSIFSPISSVALSSGLCSGSIIHLQLAALAFTMK